MKTQIEIWVAWILVRIQIVTANLDPEILQWPGGFVIALLLWLYAAARPLCSVGADAFLKVHASLCLCRRVAPAETHGGRSESNFIAVFERDRHVCGYLVDEGAVGTFKIFDARGAV
jgi:hypothetical protein